MRLRTLTALAGALALSLTGCAGSGSAGSSSNTVTYWLWDANQQPAYQACATAFEKQNPGLHVKITQLGWDDYWTKLTASFIAGTEPDVFTDHIQKFGQFADLKVLEPLDDLGIDDTAYQPGLAANWMGQDGHRYGAPKDWDTVALFYNKKMTDAAGLTAAQLGDLAWNPEDGGSFEKAVAHLTVDRNGRRGDEPGFDKDHVKVYGLATNGGGDGDGQTQWSPFTASAGWNYTDKKRWGTEYQYDSPAFQSAVKWYFGLAEKGYMAPFTDYNSQSNQANTQIAAGKAATAFDGAWMISTYAGFKGLDMRTAVTPEGPTGKRATMMNGLADSITRNARNKEGARKWVKYLASDECQRTVGGYGIVFPATPDGTAAAVAAYRKKGIDVTAFTEPVADKKDFTTFSYPITTYAADVYALMHPAMQDIFGNGRSVTSLDETNDQINLILSQ
ncbi:multiple sugar transport system substrate-binding protein [Streptomyces sp. SAI-208]|jgi:multiple sugar transport system substrate-binding protein|uniref:ABC transporter substrate-binding protein n=1 Tax=unclassified Streptomyces TaxID=2593676 RepID=UPI002476B35F|nr:MULTISPECIES: sugar ABC transporter substrate-binding protein [unclassified Streptomyces]MDH6514568.1 multiple sugar transport system substrate-binding protein [Streptomyces sp. SAI-090]MDH6546748.1 multiple sugar transport system substrate-binding protein [Streptomyces sp. SAI-041]MDH6605410.1 multiple sugar transport system substrate-binding protein [Streptomyces sp. SAI-208]MDH6621349.1 multiple sugar transport system substrate-binding protein [Streptomyces sp. SAI-135]